MGVWDQDKNKATPDQLKAGDYAKVIGSFTRLSIVAGAIHLRQDARYIQFCPKSLMNPVFSVDAEAYPF